MSDLDFGCRRRADGPAEREMATGLAAARSPALALLENRRTAAVLLAADSTVLWTSAQYRKLVGCDSSLGRPWAATLPEDMAAHAQRLMSGLLNHPGVDEILVSARPRPRWFEVTSAAARGEDGAPSGVLLEVAELTGTDDPATPAPVIRDQLTGLYNRRAFLDLAGLDVPELSPFQAVAFVDVRRFRSINELWGHFAGDECLIAVGRWLRSIASPGDLVARLSGDEFLILCTAGSELAGELHQSAERTLDIVGRPMRVALQAGLARRQPDGSLLDTAEQAERALSAAKREAWRTVVEWLPRHSAAANEVATVEQAVRHAVSAGKVAVHFQPLVNLARQEVRGFESLIRLGGAAGELPVEQIIAASHQLGLTPHLAEVVFDQALAGGRSLRTRFPGAVIGVNISRQFLGTGLAIDTVVRCATRAELPLSQVVVELTEDVAAGLTAELLVTEMRRGAELGLRMVIDDFGRGETSLALLRTLPLSAIKLDRSLLPVDDDPRAWNFLEGAASLLRNLTDDLVVEGVETAFQSGRLREIGIELQQGYLFGRPKSSDYWLAHPVPLPR